MNQLKATLFFIYLNAKYLNTCTSCVTRWLQTCVTCLQHYFRANMKIYCYSFIISCLSWTDILIMQTLLCCYFKLSTDSISAVGCGRAGRPAGPTTTIFRMRNISDKGCTEKHSFYSQLSFFPKIVPFTT